jgi:hypothetical protein
VINSFVLSLVFALVSAEPPRDPMFQATMVRLDFRDRPLLDLVNALNEEHEGIRGHEGIRQRIVSEVPTARHRLPKGQCRHFGYNALN